MITQADDKKTNAENDTKHMGKFKGIISVYVDEHRKKQDR